MAWRYRRSVKLLPGIRMNMGRKGVTSFSFGGRGMTVNVNKRGTKTTYSLPGTGLSYQTQRTGHPTGKPQVTVSRSPGSVPPPKPGINKPIVVYACVGIVALITYGALQPKSPQVGGAIVASRATTSSPISLPSASDLIPSAVAAPAPTGQHAASAQLRAATTTTGANIRSQPSRTASIVKVLDKGTEVLVLESSGGWARVASDNRDPLGWINSSLLRPN